MEGRRADRNTKRAEGRVFARRLSEQNESYKQTPTYPRKLDSDPKQGFEPSILQTIKLLDCCRSRSTPGCLNLTSGIRESGRLNSHENGNGEFLT